MRGDTESLFGSHRQAPDLKSRLRLFKSGRLIKRYRRGFFRAGHEHGFIATFTPGPTHCSFQDSLTEPAIPIACVSDHILDESIGRSATRQVRYDNESAACDDFSI